MRKGGERLDRVSYAKDIAVADRGYMHPDPLAHVLEQGADVIVRTPWKGARWLGKDGKPFDLLAALTVAEGVGLSRYAHLDWRKKAPPLALRLVAFRKPKEAAEAARAKARAARKARRLHAISGGTLDGSRMGYSRHLARCKGVRRRRDRRVVPRALARRACV